MDRNLKTLRAVNKLQEGMQFQEMYSYWIFIVSVTKTKVWYVDSVDLSKLNIVSKTKFKDKISYKQIPGYWVSYSGKMPKSKLNKIKEGLCR